MHSDTPSAVEFSMETFRFQGSGMPADPKALEAFPLPLSVILQVTRRCNLDCVFCSEISPLPDPSLAELALMREHLQGVQRIYLSGGEPLLRPDLVKIAQLFKPQCFVGLPTNAMIHESITDDLASSIDFANVGIEGPRNVTTRVRGDYDEIVKGIGLIREKGIPLSLCSVVMASNVDCIPLVCQLADVFEARKVKLILPVMKGNAFRLPASEIISDKQALDLFAKLLEQKTRYGWRPKITLTTWTPEVEGYSILVYPDGKVYAWPVYDEPEKVELLGDLLVEDIRAIWQRNPYRANHVRKYLGETILVC